MCVCITLEGCCAEGKAKTWSCARGFRRAAVRSLVFLITESFFSLSPLCYIQLSGGGSGRSACVCVWLWGANTINGSLNIICANELAFVPVRAIVPLLHISGRPFVFPPCVRHGGRVARLLCERGSHISQSFFLTEDFFLLLPR